MLLCLLSSAYSQYPITSTNYQTEDSGRQETLNEDGSVQGQYNYVNPNGKIVTVVYTAGKHGFQVQGDSIPAPQLYQTQQIVPQRYQQFQANPQLSPYQTPSRTSELPLFLNQDNVPKSYQQQNQQHYQQYPTGPQFHSPALGQFSNQFPNQLGVNKNLFTQASNPYPAASSGQYENYQKALEEEREEAAKQQNLALEQATQSYGLTSYARSDNQPEQGFGSPVEENNGLPYPPYNIEYGPQNGYRVEYDI